MTTGYSLLTDELLRVIAARAVRERVNSWLPLAAMPTSLAEQDGLTMHLGANGEFYLPLPGSLPAPSLRIGRHACHIMDDVAWIAGAGVRARVELEAGRAFVEIAPDEVDLVPVLSLIAALLLARARRYLLHCAAVRAPDGAVWLLAGDSHAGKTSTALGLARVGWHLLSDDHVVLYHADDGWRVDGWPRVLHPDQGWRDGVLTGSRGVLDPRDEAGISVEATGPLRAVLMPQVVRGAERTVLEPATSAEALTMLLRQTAWSLGDARAVPHALADLSVVAALPAFHLRLAPDTYREPARLHALLTVIAS